MNTKTDRELLELAAKAAGNIWLIKNANTGETYYGVCVGEGHFHGSSPQWNPITDDGDALRLAVKLELNISHRTVDVDVSRGDVSASVYVPTYSGRGEATRLAIVRAAAKVGRSMQ